MDQTENRGVLSRVTDWATHPFSSDMSLLEWFLFLGLALIAAYFWRSVINHIVE